METGTTASPPSYSEALSHAADDLLQPVILVLDNQSIYAESNPTVHLYEVNRSIASLGRATLNVKFSRSAGSTSQRSKHIYDLHHTPCLERAPSTHSAEYFIEYIGASTRRLGSLGFRTVHGVPEDWTALPVDMKGWSDLLCPPFVADAAPVFEAHHREGVCKWTDGNGHDVAIEYDSDKQHRLLVTASLRRDTLDALVALWCCRLWQQSVNRQWPTLLTVYKGLFSFSWKDYMRALS
ncbi:hypothetical protein CONLIGDRAFT_626917 [Coniochaeta ligniaria NRRL 30616]|uniref:Uncharacterized protein n=1 Tax=Coniochaeta ligniaria NRRL 30616 TaxID=1408157 RepID=A0A1J7J516_9PEZI|nr:hypothetical protein CONLIGDRAFT_626917 [Coniochaeta ligniaria NRRL 30616]